MSTPFHRLALVALLSSGCVESFNPFPEGDAATDVVQRDASARDSGPACAPLPLGCDPLAYMVESCGSSTCHGADQVYEGSRYEGGDVFGRLVGLPSGQHGGFGSPDCARIPVIDPNDIPNSMMLRKLRAQQGACGDRMPFDGVPLPETIACVESWIEREVCLRRDTDASPPGVDAGTR